MEKKITLCIPRVCKDIKVNEIYNKILSLDIGKIYKIIELPVKNNEFKKILIIMNFKGTRGKELEKIVKEGKSLKIVYNDPWYWKLVEYKRGHKIE